MYGSPLVLNRGHVWSLIEARIHHLQEPFIIMGDLNQVRGWSEKLSSHRRTIPGASVFNDLIFRNRLVDLPSQGVWYTWCNNRRQSVTVYERLDRVLASSSWVTKFTSFSLVTLPIQRSDHSPLLLDSSRMDLRGKKWDRFEAVWLTDLTTQEILHKVWKLPIHGADSCLRHQTILFQHLKNWNALSFRSMKGQIEDI
ncbi:hypothetical protein CsSME_00040095 [Camellia sinensis var. sinensis]